MPYMKATGIVRRIDDLGRVVIPKEIRRTMRIREGDPLEIFTDNDGEVIFKKIFADRRAVGVRRAVCGGFAQSRRASCGDNRPRPRNRGRRYAEEGNPRAAGFADAGGLDGAASRLWRRRRSGFSAGRGRRARSTCRCVDSILRRCLRRGGVSLRRRQSRRNGSGNEACRRGSEFSRKADGRIKAGSKAADL